MAGLIAIAGSTAGTLATVASTVGTGLSIAGKLKQGRDARDSLNYQSRIQEQNADLALASGQRAAQDRHRQGELIKSRQRAVAAASGGGSDQSVINMMGLTEFETKLAADTEIFNAEQQARGFEDQAEVARVNARRSGINGTLNALGTAAGGAASMFGRFAARQKYKIPRLN